MRSEQRGFIRSIQLKRDRVPSFDVYPYNIPSIARLHSIKMHPKVTYFVGENGSGKSTLLEAIAVAWGFNAEGGSRNFNFSTRSSHSELFKYLKLVKGVFRPGDGFFLRAESYFNLATEIDRLGVTDSYGGTDLHEMSHGESFLALFQNRLRTNGLFLFDEPEAALSPSRQLSTLALMHRLIASGSQFIIATHSPILMAYPEATIYRFSEEGIEPQKYEETDQVTLTHDFLNRREKMLRILLNEDEEI